MTISHSMLLEMMMHLILTGTDSKAQQKFNIEDCTDSIHSGIRFGSVLFFHFSFQKEKKDKEREKPVSRLFHVENISDIFAPWSDVPVGLIINFGI